MTRAQDWIGIKKLTRLEMRSTALVDVPPRALLILSLTPFSGS